MPKDLKYRIPNFQAPPKRSPWNARRMLMMFLAIAAIVLLGFFIQIGTKSSLNPSMILESLIPKTETHFTFFRILEDQESRVSEAAINEEARNIRLGQPATEGRFYIQAGIFKSKQEALALKETLEASEKMKAAVAMIHLDFSTWYRVELGPYRTLGDAEKIRDFLRERTMDSIINTRTPQ